MKLEQEELLRAQQWATEHLDNWILICCETSKGISAIEFIRIYGALHADGLGEIRMAFAERFGYPVQNGKHSILIHRIRIEKSMKESQQICAGSLLRKENSYGNLII